MRATLAFTGLNNNTGKHIKLTHQTLTSNLHIFYCNFTEFVSKEQMIVTINRETPLQISLKRHPLSTPLDPLNEQSNKELTGNKIVILLETKIPVVLLDFRFCNTIEATTALGKTAILDCCLNINFSPKYFAILIS